MLLPTLSLVPSAMGLPDPQVYKIGMIYTLSEAWADLMAAQGFFGTDFYDPIHSAPSLGQRIDAFNP